MEKKGDIYVEKRTMIYALFCTGMLIAYMGSLRPWFTWPISRYYPFIAAIPFLMAVVLSNSSKSPQFHRKSFLVPTALTTVLLVYQAFVNQLNIFGYIHAFASVLMFATLYAYDIEMLKKAVTFICKVMACILCVSFPFFILYLLGFTLPHFNLTNEAQTYSFDNYIFFLIDDRSLIAIFPRFQSVFTEPGHLGSATSFLLFTQLGQWKKWYNIVLIGATLASFSLAAYVFIVVIALMGAWIQKKHFILKVTIVIVLIAAALITATLYNNGDNLVNTLIVERLEVVDGKMVGDNRVTEDFENDFDSFMKTDDVFLGRDFDREDYGFGNAGYRVYIYDYGFVGVFLVFILYVSFIFYSENTRAALAAIMVAIIAFIVRDTPTSYYFLFSFFITATIGPYSINKVDT